MNNGWHTTDVLPEQGKVVLMIFESADGIPTITSGIYRKGKPALYMSIFKEWSNRYWKQMCDEWQPINSVPDDDRMCLVFMQRPAGSMAKNEFDSYVTIARYYPQALSITKSGKIKRGGWACDKQNWLTAWAEYPEMPDDVMQMPDGPSHKDETAGDSGAGIEKLAAAIVGQQSEDYIACMKRIDKKLKEGHRYTAIINSQRSNMVAIERWFTSEQAYLYSGGECAEYLINKCRSVVGWPKFPEVPSGVP